MMLEVLIGGLVTRTYVKYRSVYDWISKFFSFCIL